MIQPRPSQVHRIPTLDHGQLGSTVPAKVLPSIQRRSPIFTIRSFLARTVA